MDIKHVAKLANLPLTSFEEKKLQTQLDGTVEYFKDLKGIKTEGVRPTSQVTGKTNELRDDVVVPGLSQEAALQNAAKTDNGFFEAKVTWE